MTDALLEGLAAQAANMVKTDLTWRLHEFHALIATYSDGRPLHRMRKIEALIVERFGEDWLNREETKDAAFEGIRLIAQLTAPFLISAVVFATVANRFHPTPALDALPPAEQSAILSSQTPRLYPAYFQMRDAIQVTVQTPERCCVFAQEIRRLGKGYALIGKPDVACAPIADLHGRGNFFIPPEMQKSGPAF